MALSLCTAGTYSSGGGTACTKCEAGRFQQLDGSTSCRLCERGAFCLEGASAPLPCAGGTIGSVPGLSSPTQCIPVGPGFWAPTGSDRAEPCATGFYCPGAAADSLYGGSKPIILSTGKTVRRNQTLEEQQTCPVGHWCTGGMVVACERDFFNPTQGASNQMACVPCPTHSSTAALASIHARQCKCVRGYYDATPDHNVTASPQCYPCPIGTLCNHVGVTLATLPLKPGYYRTSAAATNIVRCPDAGAGCGAAIECLHSRSGCAGGDSIALSCRPGLTGVCAEAARELNTRVE